VPTELLSSERLKTLLSGARGRRVAILGDAMLDLYLKGDTDRVSPEAPVPIVRVREKKLALGGAANVAQNVVAAGARADLVAAVGNDGAAAQLKGLLRDLGADSGGLVEVRRPTTTKTRVVARAQQLIRIDEEEDSDLPASEIEKFGAAIERAIAQSDALILEDYNKGVLVAPLIARAIAAATKKKIPVVVDPKYKNFFAYNGATVFKPNRRELEAALGASFDLEHPEALPAILEKLGVAALLLTLSEQGMALIERDGGRGPRDAGVAANRVHRIPTTAREVFDVVGAGDTVTAYLAVMLAAGATPLEAAVVANFAAGVEVGKSGAATVSAAEVIAAYEEHAKPGDRN
jgi:D-beta-D-heptose 7-phosphate kinase/D-beta-D-heptose 1-phosphate adenosyltransferase